MKPTRDQLIAIYRRSLARYEANGDVERVRIQRALIERQEAKRKGAK